MNLHTSTSNRFAFLGLRKLRFAMIFTLLLGFSAPTFTAFAQDTAAPTKQADGKADGKAADPKAKQGAKSDTATTFEAGGDIATQDLPAWPFVYIAYVCFWILLLGYVGYLWRQQRTLDTRINQVNKRLDDIDQALDDLES